MSHLKNYVQSSKIFNFRPFLDCSAFQQFLSLKKLKSKCDFFLKHTLCLSCTYLALIIWFRK